MSSQNLVSYTLTAEKKTAINQTLDSLKDHFSFTIPLTPAEIKSIFKAGDSYSPFIEKAYNALNQFPQIMPAIFDAQEFKNDYQLAMDLTAIITKLKGLLESLENTQVAAFSDAMVGGLEIYSHVQANKDKVPGLNAIADDMGSHFKKSKKPKDETKK
jgi:hypothetical protein